MITCCDIAFASVVANVVCLAIFRNYYLKMKGLTIELKKKNGKEQKQIDDLQSKLLTLQSKGNELRKEIDKLKKND